MRMPGLGGKVVAKAGGTAVLTPGGEIYAALERGVIDAAEWVGPHDDLKLGLQNTARYYYYPGWHEPGTVSEFGFNKKAYEALPVDLRRILDHAVAATQVMGSPEYEAKNTIALERLKTEFKGKVEIVQLPAPVLRDLKKIATDVVRARVREEPDGEEGVRVVREVPGAARRLAPDLRRRVPPARGAMTSRRVAGAASVARSGCSPRGARPPAQEARRPYRIGVLNEAWAANHPTVEGPQGGAPRARPRGRPGRHVRHPVHRGQARGDARRRRRPSSRPASI